MKYRLWYNAERFVLSKEIKFEPITTFSSDEIYKIAEALVSEAMAPITTFSSDEIYKTLNISFNGHTVPIHKDSVELLKREYPERFL